MVLLHEEQLLLESLDLSLQLQLGDIGVTDDLAEPVYVTLPQTGRYGQLRPYLRGNGGDQKGHASGPKPSQPMPPQKAASCPLHTIHLKSGIKHLSL